MTDFQTGVYRHYKGALYLVLSVAHDANIDGRSVVVYVRLYEREGLPVAVRTMDDFIKKLCAVRVDNTLNHGWHTCAEPLDELDRCSVHGHTGRIIRRFAYVGLES